MKCLIAIAISRDWVESEFLMQMGTWQLPSEWQFKIGWYRQFTAAERHNVMINEAIYNYDRIIFMDTDQWYPPEYITKMLEHKEPVVTALNVSRYHPFENTIYNITGQDVQYGVIVPLFESVEPPVERVFEVDMTGTGSLMVDPQAIKHLGMPLFKDLYDPEGCVRVLCDDFYFCWQLHNAGIKVTVDQSIMVKHLTKLMVAPHSSRFMKQAWESVNSGFGLWKDGKQA